MSGLSVGDDVTVFDFIELLQASDWVTSPVYAGWLQKKSKSWFVSSLFTQMAWQPKWVALHGLELIYMDEEPTSANTSHLSIRRTTIGSTTRIMPYVEDENDDHLCFSIQPDCTKPQTWEFRAESEEEKSNWLIKISQVHAIASWLDSYTKEKVLGVGAQGTVYEMVHKSTGQRLAVKEVNIENDKQMQMALTEAKLLMEITKNVSHPCIMQIEKVFQVADKFYLVFPLCTGGELYEAVVRRGHFTERKASRILHDLISALHALHSYNVLHLDIKPENILFESNDPNARIKLTDFGLSKVFTETLESRHLSRPTQAELEARAESFINCGNFNADHVRGTFGYMSPELILTGYCSTASDVFSAGVILYILLCGYPPFNSKSVRQLFVRTVKGAYKLTGPEWDNISLEAKDLIKKMLDVNPETRIGTSEVLRHPWIQRVVEADALRAKEVSVPRSHASSEVESTLFNAQTSLAHRSEGLHGKCSMAHGQLLNGTLNGNSNGTGNGTFSNTASSVETAPDDTLLDVSPNGGSDGGFDGSSDVDLTSALDHLAGTIKDFKTEKLAKTITRLMLAKQVSGGSKLAALYLQSPGKPLAAAAVQTGAGTSLSPTPGATPRSTRSCMTPIVEEQEDDSSHILDRTPSTNSFTFQFDEGDLEKLSLHTPCEHMSNATSEVSVPATPTAAVAQSGNKDDELLQMMNSEAKEAVTGAIFEYFGANERGHLTLEQFIHLIMKLGLVGVNKLNAPGSGVNSPRGNSTTTTTPTTTPLTASSVGLFGVLIARFTDRGNKGYVTMEDFFTAQVLILQRNELYLRAIYKQYQHSVYYPGRQVNFNNAMHALRGGPGPGAVRHRKIDTESSEIDSARAEISNKLELDVPVEVEVEPPKYITAKHVAAVFERFGFDPRNGTRVFHILHDVLAKLKRERRVSSYGTNLTNSSTIGINLDSMKDNRLRNSRAANIPYGASEKNQNPVDTNNNLNTTIGTSTSNRLVDSVPTLAQSVSSSAESMFTAIGTSFGFYATPVEGSESAELNNNTNNNNNSTPTAACEDDSRVVKSATTDDRASSACNSNGPLSSNGSPTTPNGTLAPNGTTSSLVASMDVEEFLHLSRMDEILVDVFSRQAHMRLFKLFQRVEGRYLQQCQLMEINPELAGGVGTLNKVVREEVQRVLDDPLF